MKGAGRLTILNGYFGNSFNEKEQVITLTLEIALFSLGQRREMMKDCLVLPKQRVMLQKTGTVNSYPGDRTGHLLYCLTPYLLPKCLLYLPGFPRLLFFWISQGAGV